MATYELLRVFVGPGGTGGNLLAVFLEGSEIPEGERQGIAAALGYSETVFVDDASRAVLHIHTPANELPFAGHPLVGTAWLLAKVGRRNDVLRPPGGEVATWTTDDLTWIRGLPEWAPDFEFVELPTPAEVASFDGASPDSLLYVWSWEDEDSGTIRARVFPRLFGIAEDEATGSGALRLAARLGRSIEIHQGVGSLLCARPGPEGSTEVGGLVELVGTKDL